MEPSVGSVQVHDSRTKSLVPVGADGRASMYVCGITPYDATHLGHAATYLTFDILNRVWRDAAVDVTYIQNVTDIDDPLLERAAATGQDWQVIAQRETELFRTDMQALHVWPPTHYESAVQSIPDVVNLIRSLDSQVVYLVDQDIYFHSDAVGDVSGLDPLTMQALFAERGGDPQRVGKRHPLDSLLWRAERAGEPAWQGELGAGRPGWHIECVAIAMRHATLPLSVQGGGRDLLFPHHDMCNAQAMALTGTPLAQAYVHTGLIGYQGEKMSKSLGNLVLVSQLRAQEVPMSAVRLALAASHYRCDREWDANVLDQGVTRLSRWRECALFDASDVLEDIRAALRTDLDTPSAIALIDGLCASSARDVPADYPATLSKVVEALLGVQLLS